MSDWARTMAGELWSYSWPEHACCAQTRAWYPHAPFALSNSLKDHVLTSGISDRVSYLSEKAMAPHSSTLAWKIPWTEEPGRLQSMGSLRVEHDWVTSLSRIGEGNGNPLQRSCLENPRNGKPWWAAVYGVAQSRARLKWLSSSSSSSYFVDVEQTWEPRMSQTGRTLQRPEKVTTVDGTE